ncbi:Crp/Fnr family transcriptional regulator [Thermophagus sp. OGC60D27]|uniref:Crp/Fnr family transcriptional regulator n=1 Tax=Thermophagus sp. OGC60D27 TaxID=3458415 RepID=UPI004037B485
MNEVVYKSPLFLGLSKDDVNELFEEVVYQLRSYTPGEIIAFGGEECRSLLIVLNGKVKGEMIDYSGRVLKIEDIHPPMPLAVAFLFGKNNRYPVTISATEVTDLLVFPKESVVWMMQRSELFLTNFLNAVSNRAQFISGKLMFLSFKTLKSKLAHYLLELDRLQNRNGKVVLNKSHEELAELFGVTRPSLSRTVRELHQQGIIQARGRDVCIINSKALLRE